MCAGGSDNSTGILLFLRVKRYIALNTAPFLDYILPFLTNRNLICQAAEELARRVRFFVVTKPSICYNKISKLKMRYRGVAVE